MKLEYEKQYPTFKASSGAGIWNYENKQYKKGMRWECILSRPNKIGTYIISKSEFGRTKQEAKEKLLDKINKDLELTQRVFTKDIRFILSQK